MIICMRICLLAWGSRGDVQPIVALGRGLRAAGHDVTVAADPTYTPLIARAGLAVEPFDAELGERLRRPEAQGFRDGTGRGGRQGLTQWRQAFRAVGPGVADHVAGLVEHHDVFVSGLITFGAMLHVARSTGKPHFGALLTPSAPTRSGAAAVFAPRPAADSVLNLGAGWAGLIGSSSLTRPVADAASARLGLAPLGTRAYLRETVRTPMLLGVSSRVVPPPRDVGDRVATTGYWVQPLDPAYEPPAELADFLAAGDAPVYLGFGSMPSADPAALFALMVAALRRSGRRGLVSGNWRGWRPERVPDGVLVVDDVPHEWLFPRTSGVVHHGGAGTTAAAIRAGRPQFVVPHFGDQSYWGRRVDELGLGPAPVRRRDLTVEGLAASITRLGDDGALRERAEAFGSQVRGEDGVAVAADTIGRWLDRGTP
jgi:sterol 3beta-glucosyltransferase